MKKSQLVVLSLIYLAIVITGLFFAFKVFMTGIEEGVSGVEDAVEAESQMELNSDDAEP